jgi:hypothetical protein
MITLEIIEIGDGRFGIQAIGESEPFEDAGEFETRAEAEEWIFNRSEQLSVREDPHTLIPGTGQGLR